MLNGLLGSHGRDADHVTPESTLKRCPRCRETLPLIAFGISRAQKSGLNIYCKACVRIIMSLSRQKVREYKLSRVKAKTPLLFDKDAGPAAARRIARVLRKLPATERVFEAIKAGANTQAAISRATELPVDEIGESLAQMLLWDRRIRTRIVKGERMYFVNEPGSTVRVQSITPREPKSHGVSTIYFAA